MPVHLEAKPAFSLVDEPLAIRIAGLEKGQRVVVRAETRDGALKAWSSQATFVASEDGVVDLTTDAPVSGSYGGIDPIGLLWSMTPSDPNQKTYFSKRKPGPLAVTVAVGDGEKTYAECKVQRGFKAPGVTSRALDEDGLVGTLFIPESSEPAPAVIVLNGSDGGMNEHAAALLASRGYATLALAYFGLEGLPPNLLRIPLEYFGDALGWMRRQAEVDPDAIAVAGHSRGGELALQVGATFPEVRAVIAGAPSSVRQSALVNYRPSSREPAWTLASSAMPFLPYRQSFGDALGFMASWAMRRQYYQAAIFERMMRDEGAVARATIEVEKINGPVLLISGAVDQLWPSAQYAEKVMDRLRAHDHPFAYQHASYEGVGHFACFPYGLPSMPPMLVISPVKGLQIGFGGTAERTARATEDAWRQIQQFLRASLRPQAAQPTSERVPTPARRSD